MTIASRAIEARHLKAGRLVARHLLHALVRRDRRRADSAPAPQADDANAEAIESVVVTARRRAESLQDTPVAVTALSAAALERQQVVEHHRSRQDRAEHPVPLVRHADRQQLGGAGVHPRHRPDRCDAAVDPGVGVYIDDVYMGRAVGAAMEFRDIANVQILRGPQGTLFGRNTIGGAVLLTTNEPGTDAGNSVRVGLGNDDLREAFGAFDLPLGGDWSARLALGMRQRDGYVTRVFDGKDLGDEDMRTGQVGVALETFRSVQPDAARRLHQGRRERLALRVPLDERGGDLRRRGEHRRRLPEHPRPVPAAAARRPAGRSALRQRRAGAGRIPQRRNLSREQHARESRRIAGGELAGQRHAFVQVDHGGPPTGMDRHA